jgi:hypothetical protein
VEYGMDLVMKAGVLLDAVFLGALANQWYMDHFINPGRFYLQGKLD